MSNSKKSTGGCLKFFVLSAGVLIGGCILYFVIVLPLNRQFNAEPSSTNPTDMPEPTNIPEDYDQAVERILTEINESMVTIILTFQSADFNVEQQSWRGAISNSSLNTRLAYNQLSKLQPPAGNEQQHTNLIDDMSDCNNSAGWFDVAMQEYRQGNVEAYLASIEQAYIWWDTCEVKLG